MTNFVKYTTAEGIEILNISQTSVTESITSHLGSINETNYENTYFLSLDSSFEKLKIVKECEDYFYYGGEEMIITKEPLDFKGQDTLTLHIDSRGSDTILNFLGLEATPYINVGDVNPFEHGFVLVSKDIEYNIIQVDQCPDTGKYIYRESSVDGDVIEDEYCVFDVDLDECCYNSYTSKELDIPLFFNVI